VDPVVLPGGIDVQVGYGGTQDFGNSLFSGKDIILAKITDPNIFLSIELTTIRFHQPAEYFKQGGFAGTVGTYQTYFITVCDNQINGGKQGLGTK
jgi:hypothetical protein